MRFAHFVKVSGTSVTSVTPASPASMWRGHGHVCVSISNSWHKPPQRPLSDRTCLGARGEVCHAGGGRRERFPLRPPCAFTTRRTQGTRLARICMLAQRTDPGRNRMLGRAAARLADDDVASPGANPPLSAAWSWAPQHNHERIHILRGGFADDMPHDQEGPRAG